LGQKDLMTDDSRRYCPCSVYCGIVCLQIAKSVF